MKDSFILYGSHEENFKMLSDADKGKLIMAIFAFVRDEDISATLKPLAKMAYVSITNQIKISNEKYDRRCETSRLNGQLGGRPRKNTSENEESKQDLDGEIDSENLKQPNKPKKTDRLLGFNDENDAEKNLNNLKKPNENLKTLYDNDYDNEYDNDKLVNKENNNKLNNTHARTREIIRDFYSEYYERGYPEYFNKYADEIIDTMAEALNQAQSIEGLTFNKVTYNFDTFIDVITKINQTLFCEVIDALLKNPDIINRHYYILGTLITMASEEKIYKYSKNRIEKLKSDLRNFN